MALPRITSPHTKGANRTQRVMLLVLAATLPGVVVLTWLYGAGTLTKSGGGSLILASTNRYDGDTVINGGMLKLAPLPVGTQAYYAFDDPNHLGADSSTRGNHLTVGDG